MIPGIFFGTLMMYLISINSMIWIKFKKRALWKGRSIDTTPLLVKAN